MRNSESNILRFLVTTVLAALLTSNVSSDNNDRISLLYK